MSKSRIKGRIGHIYIIRRRIGHIWVIGRGGEGKGEVEDGREGGSNDGAG
ncbi:hypothetical protein [Vulcanisaeta sp. JCM 14467]|nr:hypothetical protein [Vulcanisaeta sp. JCM 14467]